MKAISLRLFLWCNGDFTENVWPINGFSPAVLCILEPQYLFRNGLHRVKNSICLLARQAISSFGLKPYSSLFVSYLKLCVNEADCKQWRQRRFAYSTSINSWACFVVLPVYYNIHKVLKNGNWTHYWIPLVEDPLDWSFSWWKINKHIL